MPKQELTLGISETLSESLQVEYDPAKGLAEAPADRYRNLALTLLDRHCYPMISVAGLVRSGLSIQESQVNRATADMREHLAYSMACDAFYEDASKGTTDRFDQMQDLVSNGLQFNQET